MSLLSDLKSILDGMSVPNRTGAYTDLPPDQYVTLVPLSDEFDLYCDNAPSVDIEAVRISIYSKTNYNALKKGIISALLVRDYTITDRHYVGYESDTKYHHYNVDVERCNEMEEE